MKKHIVIPALFLFLALFVSSSLFSQSPQGIPYQAVMRNADGSVMASSEAVLTFMIHDGTANGTVVYQESHSLISNAQGLVSCVVGNGVVSEGNFSGINWGSGAKFLHVMMGTTHLGTQQMMSVPYALYAGSTHVSVSATGDTLTVGGQSVIVPGISAANPTNNIPTSGLGSQVLPGNTTCANEYINVVGCNGQTSLTYDGRNYDLVEIGGQCWFADNLATDQYRNGDPIPTGLDNTTWQNTTSGAFAIYNNDAANDATYGKLYNWFTTVDSRGLCPIGWHVPTDCEWMYLEGSLGMTVTDQETAGYRGTNEGGALKATTGWTGPNTGATNSSGFTAFPGGVRSGNATYVSINGTYHSIGNYGVWWCSIEYSTSAAWCRLLDYYNSNEDRGSALKQDGFSVRCLKDSETPPIQGCTDGAACNFLANANEDDGSCLYQNATCDDGNANTINDVINGNCQCAGVQLSNSGLGSQVLPGNTTCANEYINVVGCNGQTSLTYDGRTYDLVEIGGQCWFADNLATDQYRNGDAIPTGLDNNAWSTTTNGAFAIYNNNPANDVTYGKLYNWYTTVDTRGLCPTGWHVPTDCEWMYLEGSLGMTLQQQQNTGNRGNLEGGMLKSISGWSLPNNGASNITGFSAIAGGNSNNSSENIGLYGFWWCSSDYSDSDAWYRRLTSGLGDIVRNNVVSKSMGLSVRCLKDSETPSIQGCIDGAACNFLANANQDDGSCLYQNSTCDDGNANTINDVINGNCQCAGVQLSNSGLGSQVLPGNTTCANEYISVTGCGGQTSLTYDGRTYDLVEIGGQCWFADNLATDQYRNGDPIPTGLDNTTWQNTTSGAFAIYNNDAANDATYGKLYNWFTTVDSRGLCPIGWHVPTDCEWMYLEGSLGMSVTDQEAVGWRGTNEGGAMKATTNWLSPNTGATNSSGFIAFPGGYRDYDGAYYVIGTNGYWWSSTEFDSYGAWYRDLDDSISTVYRTDEGKRFGFSVRCVRD